MKYVVEIDTPKSCEITFNVKKVTSFDVTAKDARIVILEGGKEVVNKKFNLINIRVFLSSLDTFSFSFTFDDFGRVNYIIMKFKGQKTELGYSKNGLDAIFVAR